MTVDDAIAQLATARHDLPKEAMHWTLGHWAEAAPRLLGMLDRYADGIERSEESSRVLFFAAHLMAQANEVRAFAPLCRLARDTKAIEDVLGDGVTVTLKRVLISTYDGRLDTLRAVIEDSNADEFVRTAALDALAYLTATRRLERGDTEAYLGGLYDTLQPRGVSFVWTGWTLAIASLGLERLTEVVRRAFEHGFIEPDIMGFVNFESDLRRTLRDPAGMIGFAHDNIAPLTDAVGELSTWYAFSAKRTEDDERRQMRNRSPQLVLATPTQPRTSPPKAVGRNDPCPCGSGRKYKKCCLQ